MLSYLDPLGAAETPVNLGGVVAGDAAREHVDKDAHRKHVAPLEGADEPHHAEEQHHETDGPQLDPGADTHLPNPEGGHK